MPRKNPKSEDLSRAELVNIIGKLRGMLYAINNGSSGMDWKHYHIEKLLSDTAFDVSDEDDEQLAKRS